MKRICILLTLLFTFFNSYAVGSLNQNTSIVKVNQEARGSSIQEYKLSNSFNREKFDYINDNKLTFNFNKGFLVINEYAQEKVYGYNMLLGGSYNHKINDRLKISPIFEYEKIDNYLLEHYSNSLTIFNNVSIGLGTKFNIDEKQELKNYLDYEILFLISGFRRNPTLHSFNLGSKYTYNLSLLKEKLNISPSIHHIIGYNQFEINSQNEKKYYVSNELIPSLKIMYKFDNFDLYTNLGLGIKIDNKILVYEYREVNVYEKYNDNYLIIKFNSDMGIKGYINDRLSMDASVGLDLKNMYVISEERNNNEYLSINPSINLVVKYDF